MSSSVVYGGDKLGSCEFDSPCDAGNEVDIDYPPYVRYLLMILLEHIMMIVLMILSARMSGIPDYIQKKIATTEVCRFLRFISTISSSTYYLLFAKAVTNNAQVTERLQTYK